MYMLGMQTHLIDCLKPLLALFFITSVRTTEMVNEVVCMGKKHVCKHPINLPGTQCWLQEGQKHCSLVFRMPYELCK